MPFAHDYHEIVNGLLDAIEFTRFNGTTEKTFKNPKEQLLVKYDGIFHNLSLHIQSDLKDDEECSICLQHFLNDECPIIISLPCTKKHIFHLECIFQWFNECQTCPLCRRPCTSAASPAVVLQAIEDLQQIGIAEFQKRLV